MLSSECSNQRTMEHTTPGPLPHNPVQEGAGVTEAESYLQDLCKRSFLSLWSYPNPFRDQRGSGNSGEGKELCDLLVVFGDDVIVFSDKSCVFPDTGNLNLDWSRWFRRAIADSAKQIWGAERWLRGAPGRLFLDSACTKPLPLKIPTQDRIRVHRIVVAHGVADRCSSYFQASIGTLTFDSSVDGAVHQNPESCEPFCVGWLDKDRGFVHVLDDASLDILLSARDTVTDFVEYLRWKEDLLGSARSNGTTIKYCGEEDLLANYLLTITDGRHGFSLPTGLNLYFLDAGDWLNFASSPQRAAQLQADSISYSWDALIEKFSRNILRGTAQTWRMMPDTHAEEVIRFFAREPRYRRRFLTEQLFGILRKTKGWRGTRVVQPSKAGEPYYCFLILARLDRSDEEYRRARRHLLEALCFVTKLICPDAVDIVGLATETDTHDGVRTEDALYLDGRNWDEEAQAYAVEMHEKHGLLTKIEKFEATGFEFPLPHQPISIKVGKNQRNQPCPCGSGKKYKRCHGR